MNTSFIRKAGVGALSIAAAALCAGALAQTSPKVKDLGIDAPKTILYVGNSFYYYNNSMHSHVLRLTSAADPQNRAQYRSTSVTISGSGLNWHDMEAYFQPGRLASYSFVGDNEVLFNKFDKPFEVVIMNDCSQCPVHPQLKDMFHEYAKKHSQTIVKNGAKPVLFMTWAYADKPEMTAQLAEQYTIAGNANDALVIPAGLAFAKALAKNPQVVLYDPDKRHPSLQGTYLSAATIYASLYRKSPVGLPAAAGMDAKTAQFLQEVAWETTREYYAR
ncbi:MAG: hypothetical protein JWO70_236 [Betaproteobacteria bacterium]|nr:hypothetical protein [Betaproteobacteria bacterium]